MMTDSYHFWNRRMINWKKMSELLPKLFTKRQKKIQN